MRKFGFFGRISLLTAKVSHSILINRAQKKKPPNFRVEENVIIPFYAKVGFFPLFVFNYANSFRIVKKVKKEITNCKGSEMA